MKRMPWNIVIPLAVFTLDVAMKHVFAWDREPFVNRVWFGFSADSVGFLLTSFAALAIVCVVWIRSGYSFSFGFLLFGGFSNAIDRIAYGGAVDYLFVGNAALNLADFSIWAGCVMILLAVRKKVYSRGLVNE